MNSGNQENVLLTLKALSELEIFERGGLLIGTLALDVYSDKFGWDFPTHLLETSDVDILLPRANHDSRYGGHMIETRHIFAGIYSDLVAQHVLAKKLSGTKLDILMPLLAGESESYTRWCEEGGAVQSSHYGFLPVNTANKGIIAQMAPAYCGVLFENCTTGHYVNGNASVAVRVPHPISFALHKLHVAGERSSSMKRLKDQQQAAKVFEYLRQDRSYSADAAEQNFQGKWQNSHASSPRRNDNALYRQAQPAENLFVHT